MKHLIWAGIFLAIILSSCSTETATITLKMSDLDNKEVVVHTAGREKTELAKANAVDGVFKVDLEIEEPQLLAISIDSKMFPVYVEKSKIEISGTVDMLDSAVVKGSKSHEVFKAYGDVMLPVHDENRQLMSEYRNARATQDKAAEDKVLERYEALQKKQKELTEKFIKDHSKSHVAAYLVQEQTKYNSDYDEVKSAFELLSSSLSATKPFKSVEEKLAKLESVKIGAVAPDFEMADSTGTMVKLSSLRGKYLLMDFWASWCSPCRAENPNVVKLYNKYADKNFDIIGISLDQSKDAWLEAIKADQLTWNHVSDLAGWQNAASQLYQVSGIPHTVLLDPEGKIIAKNLRGKALEDKLAELLGE